MHTFASPLRTALQVAPDKTALVDGESTFSFRALNERCERLAAALHAMGVGKGDRVCIYLPMILELPIVMLGCARIGAIHSVVFGGFAANELADTTPTMIVVPTR